MGIRFLLVGLCLLGVGVYIAAATMHNSLTSLQNVNTDNWDKHTKTVYHFLPITVVLFTIAVVFIPLIGGSSDEGDE